MSDRRLQVFNAVAKHLSFTKAADALFMTQPAVTFQIRQLEEQLNTRLFDRAHGRISLTFAGTIALDYAARILALSEELDARMKELSGQLAGPLLIGASTTIADFLLPQILGAFKARYPAVVPRLFVPNSEAVQARPSPSEVLISVSSRAIRTCQRWAPTCVAKTSCRSYAHHRIGWPSRSA